MFYVFDLFINCVFVMFYISMYFSISLLVVRFLTSYCVYISNCSVVAMLLLLYFHCISGAPELRMWGTIASSC